MVSMAKVKKGIADFFDAELLPKLLTGNALNDMLMRGAGVAVTLRADRLIMHYLDTPAGRALGAIDDKGNIDVEYLRDVLTASIPDGVWIGELLQITPEHIQTLCDKYILK